MKSSARTGFWEAVGSVFSGSELIDGSKDGDSDGKADRDRDGKADGDADKTIGLFATQPQTIMTTNNAPNNINIFLIFGANLKPLLS